MNRISLIVIIVCVWGMVVKADSLKTYRARRNLERSHEPTGNTGKKITGSRIFVIQKHEASHLHYDFRLSIDGVLKSWALPKVPSSNPRIKRLAIATDDHPLAYARFEGIITEGNYGAGTVMVWDRGTYTNIKTKNGKKVSMKECIKQGTIEIFLKGEKLYGAYALVRTHLQGGDNWLLIKIKDEYANISYKDVTKSALTGRTMTHIRRDARTSDVGKKR